MERARNTVEAMRAARTPAGRHTATAAVARRRLLGAVLLAAPATVSAGTEDGGVMQRVVLATPAPTLRLSMIMSCVGLLIMTLVLVMRHSLVSTAWSKLRARGVGAVSLGQAGLVLFSCGLFMVIGPALMMLNKHIMQELRFVYPLSLSGLGLLASSLFSRAAVGLGLATVRPESLEVVAGRNWFKLALPIGACKAATLATGNAVYLHLGLGFIQMLKAFTPAVVLVVMRICGAGSPSRTAVGFVFVIVAGTMVEVNGEMHATAMGLLLMMLSEMLEATCLVLMQKLLQNSKFTVMEGLYVLAPPGALCLFSAAAFLEWPSIIKTGSLDIVRVHPLSFVAAALLGLAVNFVSMQLVRATSSLFCKILNTMRCVGLVFVGALFYGEEISSLEIFGYSIALLGFVGYNCVQVFPEAGERLENLVRRCCCSSCGAYVVVDEPEGGDKGSA